MKSLRIYIVFSIFTCFVSSSIVAQIKNKELQIGYFAPYLSNMGGSIGYVIDLNKFQEDSKEQRKSMQKVQLLTQLGYFTQNNVSQNILFNPELVYRWQKLDKRFFLFSSVGTGYLLSFKRQDGTLNLGTGETDYRFETLNYFLPTLNIGFGVDPKKHIGFYFKTTYGRKLNTQNADAGFVGILTGFILNFDNKIINDKKRIHRKKFVNGHWSSFFDGHFVSILQ